MFAAVDLNSEVNCVQRHDRPMEGAVVLEAGSKVYKLDVGVV